MDDPNMLRAYSLLRSHFSFSSKILVQNLDHQLPLQNNAGFLGQEDASRLNGPEPLAIDMSLWVRNSLLRPRRFTKHDLTGARQTRSGIVRSELGSPASFGMMWADFRGMTVANELCRCPSNLRIFLNSPSFETSEFKVCLS